MMTEITKKVSNFTDKTRKTFWQFFTPEWRKFTLAAVFGLGLFGTFIAFNESANFSHLCYSILGIYGLFVGGQTALEIKNGKNNTLIDDLKKGIDSIKKDEEKQN